MFVRWKKRKCTGKYRSQFVNFYLDVVLVENYREDGKVKQRFIKHLGTVEDRDLYQYTNRYFWNQVNEKLDSLNLKKSEREKIENKIKEKIPFPTKEAMDELMAEYNKRMESLKGNL